jgi:bacteriocin-like protein
MIALGNQRKNVMTANPINTKSETLPETLPEALEQHELSSEELNAVSGGQLKALETFGKALQKAGQI